MSTQKISLTQAILININIMIGAGIFINAIPFIKTAGILSPFIYLLVGILMMPLIFSITELLKKFPGGNFYTFAHATLGRFWAFISTWSYFCAKLASSTLMIHFSVKLIQSVLPAINNINTFFLDVCIIALFTYLNTANIKTGSNIQILFIVFKMSTILFVILASLYALIGSPLLIGSLDLSGIPATIPQAIYVFAGFEAACSISRHIEHAEKNAPRAVMLSFFIALTIYVLYQFLFYQMVGSQNLNNISYVQGLPLFFQQLSLTPQLLQTLTALFQLAIACSALGGAYGILFTNNWNLFMLAEKKCITFSDVLVKTNQHAMPYYCLIAEFGFSLLYLGLSRGNSIFLQQINSFGCTITYLLSTLALFMLGNQRLLASAGLFSCSLLLIACINAFLTTNYVALITFCIILLVGIGSYFLNRHQIKK